ncbi:hypothetical protein FJZ31_21795 [Candidatus Poribacteria bacterium]|nr:hypothetical protein [Candidatus Poribacteria bacterium]
MFFLNAANCTPNRRRRIDYASVILNPMEILRFAQNDKRWGISELEEKLDQWLALCNYKPREIELSAD